MTNNIDKSITVGGQIIDSKHRSVFCNSQNATASQAFHKALQKSPSLPLNEEIEAYAQIIAGVLGIIGGFWIIVHYGKRRILNNIIGLIIYATAFCDIIQGLGYVEMGIGALTNYTKDWSLDFNTLWFNIKEAVFSWSAITASLLVIMLASNTLYIVRFNGIATSLHRFKVYYIIICFVIPLFIYFIPVSLAREQPLFHTRTRKNGCLTFWHCEFQLYLFGFLITFNLVFSLVAYFLAHVAIRDGTRIDSSMDSNNSRVKNTVSKLIKLYAISILVGWVPYLIRYWYVRVMKQVNPTMAKSGDIGDLFEILRSFTAPLRGYLHALAVHIVNRSTKVSEQSWLVRICKVLFLINTREENSQKMDDLESIERSCQEPQWEVSQDPYISQYSQLSRSGSRISQL